jgi:predicted SprT family Zn-dependent metalloprotease
LTRTVPHEMAHLAVGIIFPETKQRGFTMDRYGSIRRKKRSIHGPEWQSIMRVLGAPVTRCHTYDTSTTTRKKRGTEIWECSVCMYPYNIGTKNVARLRINPRSAWCRKCGKGVGTLRKKVAA